MALAATWASTATAATIVVEPFGSGWTPGTTWATSGTYTPQVVTDNTQTPATAMRLSPGSPGNQVGLLSYATPLPTSEGLDIRFKMAQWAGTINGGSRTADGLTFFLRKGSESSNATGYLGGSLGYAPYPSGSHVGLAGGLVGVGFDQWGNFTDPNTDGTDCSGLGQAAPGIQDNTIGIRGPGTGTTGYCYLGRTTAGTVQFGTTTDTRDGRARSVRITVDPATQANPKITVYYGATASATLTQVLQVAAPAALLAEPTYRFGFTGSTATNTQNNEVWDLQVSNLVPPPATETPTTSPAGATTDASAAAGATGATGATFRLAVGAGSVVLMSLRASEAGRLIVSGARGAGWKTPAITPKSIAVSQATAGTVNMTATITPATTALLLTGSVKVRLAATMVSPSGSRTTSYKTIKLRRAAPLPVAG
jgi:hypothetical protein